MSMSYFSSSCFAFLLNRKQLRKINIIFVLCMCIRIMYVRTKNTNGSSFQRIAKGSSVKRKRSLSGMANNRVAEWSFARVVLFRILFFSFLITS